MPTAAELKELATPLLEHLAKLEAEVTALEANRDRLTTHSNEIVAGLRQQATVEARAEHDRQVAAEKVALKAERERLEQDRAAAAKDRADAATALAAIRNTAEQKITEMINSAHLAARQALQGD